MKRVDSHQMEEQILRPSKESITVKGKLAYSESLRAWNTIRLKKEILNEFIALREKQKNFSYKLSFYQDYKKFEKALRKMKKDKLPLPLMMWFIKEKNS